ncbi:hypothetical protein ElyMa_006265800 [Elysia marginata]|uniref:Uncharacterized protein n=1 Tax=Elysia marginata TaxID=1093978 RepID=A0AAV4HAB5_9GAST|nr:hypothetical protein ElyMa_006265800 [Elysia marginata]
MAMHWPTAPAGHPRRAVDIVRQNITLGGPPSYGVNSGLHARIMVNVTWKDIHARRSPYVSYINTRNLSWTDYSFPWCNIFPSSRCAVSECFLSPLQKKKKKNPPEKNLTCSLRENADLN